MIKKIFLLFTYFISVFAGYKCTDTNLNKIYCSNFKQSELKLLENTNWIPVLWDSGKCYFHNKLTNVDTDDYPLKYKLFR